MRGLYKTDLPPFCGRRQEKRYRNANDARCDARPNPSDIVASNLLNKSYGFACFSRVSYSGLLSPAENKAHEWGIRRKLSGLAYGSVDWELPDNMAAIYHTAAFSVFANGDDYPR